MSFQFFADAGLTVPLTKLTLTRGATPSELNFTIFLGSNVAGEQLQNSTSPGVDPVRVIIVDSASGSGVEAAEVKIAASYSGLSSAVAGDPLDLGSTVMAGSANAVAIYGRVNAATTTPATYADVSLQVENQLIIGS